MLTAEDHAILAEAEKRAGYKLRRFFRDDGPFRRELYPKHLELFAGGAEHRERCFMAANRCVTPWTFLETPTGPQPAAEVLTATGGAVLAWADGVQCVRPMQRGFLVGIQPAFRVHLDSGRWFDCTRTHRVLTVAGWLSLDQLVSLASGRRLWQTAADYPAHCVADGHLDDPRPPQASDSAPSPLPSPDDAQRPVLSYSLSDAAARTLARIHACPASDRFSTPDDRSRYADLFALFAGARLGKSVQPLTGHSAAVQRWRAASDPQQSWPVPPPGRWWDVSLDHADPSTFGASSTPTPLASRGQDDPQSAATSDPYRVGGRLFHDGRHTAIFYSLSHPTLVGGESIVAVVPLGLQPIVDGQVPGANTYMVSRTVHHNCGKTQAGGFECTLHLSGAYDTYAPWWKGRRFTGPIRMWASGDTSKTTRDIIQDCLYGPPDAPRTGMIPGHLIVDTSTKQGIPDALESVWVQHVSGGKSVCQFKSYDQRREAFQGTSQHVIWLDEECPDDIYAECLLRTARTSDFEGGMILLTFTPLMGMTPLVLSFLPGGVR